MRARENLRSIRRVVWNARRRFAWFALCLLACGGSLGGVRSAPAQQLEQVRHDAENKDAFQPLPATDAPAGHAPMKGPAAQPVDDLVDDWSGQAILYALAAPVWAPIALTGDDFQPKPLMRFPFSDGAEGYVVEYPETCHAGKSWTLQTSFEYDAAFSDLQRLSGEALLSTAARFDFDLQGDELFERAHGQLDSLYFGRANLLYRFAQNEYGQFRAGAGVNWLADSHVPLGVNFNYSFQIFPVKGLAFTSGIDWGTLGHTNVFHARATVGIVKRQVEVFTGLEYQRISNVEFGGPVAGLRFYF
ncbi:MAG TPA: hypothetical protein VFE24_05125 [Pirellulales bacterium]|jgi:hypothetical protein|nr:hypothetical protein [Pirellulales bacterium]